jgi:hypothetical protein
MIVSGLATLPLMVVTPDSKAYLLHYDAFNHSDGRAMRRETHIIFHAAIPEFSTDNLQYLAVQPSAFRHGSIRIPVWSDFLELRVSCGRSIGRVGVHFQRRW